MTVPETVIIHLKNVNSTVEANNPKVGAIHGTSLEAVHYLIKNGTLLGRLEENVPYYHLRDISAFPTRQLNGELIDQSDESRENPVIYARLLAEEHSILTSLGFSLSDDQARKAVTSLLFDEVTDFFLEQGITQEQIDQAIAHASEKKGFLIGLSPTIQQDPDIIITAGDPREGDLNIRPSQKGLLYTHISGIEPLGPIEKTFLQESFSSVSL